MIQAQKNQPNYTKDWLILGIGNPILGDDGVGISTARLIEKRLPTNVKVDIKEDSVGGLDLVEQLLGYKHAILIDSIINPELPEGSLQELTIKDFEKCKHAVSPHTTSFFQAWQLLEKIEPTQLPSTLKVIAITIKPVKNLSEKLSPTIEAASLKAAKLALTYLKRNYPK